MLNPNDSEIRPKQSAVEILRFWQSFNEDQIKDVVEVLRGVGKVEDLPERFRQKKWTCGEQQFLTPMFKHLYPQIKGDVQAELSDLGLEPEMIDKYFLELGADPSLVLAIHPVYSKSVPKEVRNAFTLKANQLMLDKLKQHLGL
ncbi:MAG: hypothetical protein AAB729_04765 [Patescibacteria group bacterium]